MHTHSHTEGVIQEIVIVDFPVVEIGIGQIERELDALPADTEHKLWFHKQLGAVLGIHNSLGSVIVDLHSIPMAFQRTAFQSKAYIDETVRQIYPTDIGLTEDSTISAIHTKFVIVEVTPFFMT